MPHIELNADLGEGCGSDAGLMPIVSRCSIACGGHAGDEASMAGTLSLAAEHGVLAGAHPSYPDREGFGRRTRFAEGLELEDSLKAQLDAIRSIADRLKLRLAHIKPHGALYNDANRDPALASMLAGLAAREGLCLIGPPAGACRTAARERSVPYIAEGFVDRAYRHDGSLLPRSEAGAVLTQAARIRSQTLALVDGHVETIDGQDIAIDVGTLCLHGDTPKAVELAAFVRDVLEQAGIDIRPAAPCPA